MMVAVKMTLTLLLMAVKGKSDFVVDGKNDFIIDGSDG